MTHEEAVRLVTATIRDRVLGGADRALPPDATLAELGFDSLGLVTVVSGLEAAVGRRFPDEYWEGRPNLRVRDLVEAVERSDVPTFEEPRPSSLHGVAARVPWRLYSRQRFALLDRSLEEGLPGPSPPPGVELRRTTAADEATLAELWPRRRRLHARRLIRRWRARGYVGLAAFEHGRALALDWLHDADPEGGVVGEAGTCLGIDLRVRRGYENRGVGVALIAYSLAVGHELGYRRQAAYVARENHSMRSACTALLGFAERGSARRTVVLGKTRWTWQRDGRAGSGPMLRL
jgi:acyl carrier protein/GNAT superfamily N-acetyltransferase